MGHSYNGLAVDLWSLGVSLYAMLVGCFLFEDPDTGIFYKKIMMVYYEEPTFLSIDAR